LPCRFNIKFVRLLIFYRTQAMGVIGFFISLRNFFSTKLNEPSYLENQLNLNIKNFKKLQKHKPNILSIVEKKDKYISCKVNASNRRDVLLEFLNRPNLSEFSKEIIERRYLELNYCNKLIHRCDKMLYLVDHYTLYTRNINAYLNALRLPGTYELYVLKSYTDWAISFLDILVTG